MPKLRYAIAALFFAASVGCWALWWRSMTTRDVIVGPGFVILNHGLALEASQGIGSIHLLPARFMRQLQWHRQSRDVKAWERDAKNRSVAEHGYFYVLEHGDDGMSVRFPLWYASLAFALVGMGVLRLRRQFSIRSALIGLAVVAALLGMVVAI